MKLPTTSGEKIIKLLQKQGFSITRQKGSHISLHKKTKEGKNLLVVVPRKKGTLLGIIKQTELTKEEFIKLIK